MPRRFCAMLLRRVQVVAHVAQFDVRTHDLGVDKLKPRRYSRRIEIPLPTPRTVINYSAFDDLDDLSPPLSLRFKFKVVPPVLTR